MANIHQQISQVTQQSSKTSSPEVSEPLSTPVKSKPVSFSLKSPAHHAPAHYVEEEFVSKFLAYIDSLKDKINKSELDIEKEIKGDTSKYLREIGEYINDHTGGLDQNLKDDMKNILKANNPYDIVNFFKSINTVINTEDLNLNWEMSRYLIEVLEDDYPLKIGRIWA